MMLSLTLATVTLVGVVSVLAALARVEANGSPMSFGEALWSSLMRTLDPGTMGDDVGWPLRVASLTVTVGGVLIVSSLIGLLANGISERAAELRRGQSPVVESGHTLVLGWSPKVFPLLSQLAIAGDGDGKTTIAVLAPLDKGEMERQIDARIPDKRGTKVVCRTGTPYEPIHIAIARPQAAKAVVVLNPGDVDGDAEVVKTTLALLRTSDLPHDVPVIAEVSGAFTASALRDGTEGRVTVVRSATVIARIAAQVCRQPGLSGVYHDLLDFEGYEIYARRVGQLDNMTFGEAVLAFEEASPIGIKRAEDGRVLLNPGADRRIAPGDEIVAIAEDEDKVVFTGSREAAAVSPGPAGSNESVERILLIGWNHMGADVVHELDEYVAPGSSLDIRVDRDVIRSEDVHVPKTGNLLVSLSDKPLGPDELRALIEDDPPDHVVVLCYKERLSEAQADARVLLTLLHLRAAIDASGHPTNIVAELLDERDVGLTPSRENDEFIVSERLTALLMAQLAESTDRGPVFDELLEQEGSEIYLKPASLYAGPDAVTFANVVASARARDEVAIGYQRCSEGSARRVVLNPPKSAALTLAAGDRVIVISETGN